ncbi:MAG: hypothetical protein ACD_62C00258G0001 [uncultured bacterium]|nr:MAG: hypothetical protein ACD_62C00258G0001 [uncultured bacterium]
MRSREGIVSEKSHLLNLLLLKALSVDTEKLRGS